MQSQRWAWTHTYAVPLFVTGLVAVVLAGAGVVGVLVFDRGADDTGDREPPVSSGDGPGTAGGGLGGPVDDVGGGEVDDCVLGDWQVVSHTEGVGGDALSISGSLTLTGDGPVVQYRPDGTGLSDYSSGVVFEAASGLGEPMPTEVTGEVRFSYRASAGTFQYQDVRSEATISFDLLGTALEEPYVLSDDPFSYECDGDTMTFENPDRGYTARLHRA